MKFIKNIFIFLTVVHFSGVAEVYFSYIDPINLHLNHDLCEGKNECEKNEKVEKEEYYYTHNSVAEINQKQVNKKTLFANHHSLQHQTHITVFTPPPES